jgi:hypothetical protein
MLSISRKGSREIEQGGWRVKEAGSWDVGLRVIA